MLKILLALFSLILTQSAALAQPYTLQTTSESYVELADPDFAMEDDSPYWNGGQVKVVRNLKVPGFGTKYDVNKGAFTVIESGYLYFESPSRTFTFYAFKSDLAPRTGAGQASEFSFKLEGTTGSKVLKMQWKNLGLELGGEDEYANFQVWMYESGLLEVKFGEMNVRQESLGGQHPVIGLLDMDGQFSTIFDEAYLTGSALSPALTYASIAKLDDAPSSGTVYRFIPASLGVDNASSPSYRLATPLVTNTLTLQRREEGLRRYAISNVLGQTVLEGLSLSSIDVSSLTSGVYFLRLQSEENEAIRFIKR